MIPVAFLAGPYGLHKFGQLGSDKSVSNRVHLQPVQVPRKWVRRQHGFTMDVIASPSLQVPEMAQQSNKPKIGRPKKTSSSGPQVIRRTGMNTAVVLSKELQEFTGKEMMRRPELVSKICQYIKENDLYSSASKTVFHCDDTLRRLLNTDGEYPLFQIHALISSHVTHPSVMGPEYEKRADELFEQYLQEKGAVSSDTALKKWDARMESMMRAQKELREKGVGLYAEVLIEPCLRPLCDGKEKLSRPQVLSSVWKYIKDHKLQDPSNGRIINVNDGLRNGLKVYDRTTIDCFHLSRFVFKHCKKV